MVESPLLPMQEAARDAERFIPWVGKIPWGGHGHLAQYSWPGESHHGQGDLGSQSRMGLFLIFSCFKILSLQFVSK